MKAKTSGKEKQFFPARLQQTAAMLFSGTGFGSENCRLSVVSVLCHGDHLASACYFPFADLYSMLYETAKTL